MKHFIFLLLIVFLSSVVYSQKITSVKQPDYIRNPAASYYGTVFTDADNSALYIIKGNNTVMLTASPNSGLYYTLSPNKKLLGYKYIDDNGNQIPSLIDLGTGQITRLSAPTNEAGQVSFSDVGYIAFTEGNDLIVSNGKSSKKYNLGYYSNSAPISPDGRFAAFNDNKDQLFLIDLQTGLKTKITDGRQGFFSPAWSPDGNKLLYSSLAGELKIYDMTKANTVDLGQGNSPSWSNDSRFVIFYRKEIQNEKVINSDIYLAAADGSAIKRLTNTSGELEADPSFGTNDKNIIYTRRDQGALISSSFSSANMSIKTISSKAVTVIPQAPHTFSPLRKAADVDTLDIPYINQVYDTPDYFNGSAACGPTSAMMVLAYYNILPKWSVRCSYPYAHYNDWGRYICDPYRFKQYSYTSQADDPNNKPAEGAYGFMWSGYSSPYSSMVGFFVHHGIQASRADAPSYETALSEINAGRPYVICNSLTSAGHIIVAHGVASQSHTLIFNDPYGNKNTPGYPSYDGKNAKYDWPGYNNGYKNLNTVWWSVSVNYSPQPKTDTLVDDLNFQNGFYLNNLSPVVMYDWKDLNTGYNGHMWYAFTTSDTIDKCYAVWTPDLPRKGYYEVSVFVPYSQAVDAVYKINTLNGVKESRVNQLQYKDTWVPLGKFMFDKGSAGYVRLGDASSVAGQAIIFDAVKWTYIDSAATSVASKEPDSPLDFKLDQNYPNPFNPSTVISYKLPYSSRVILKVYDMLGNEVASLADEQQAAGIHYIVFDAVKSSNGKELPSGIYVYRLQAGSYSSSRKMLLLK